MPTFADLIGVRTPVDLDGISLTATLAGVPTQQVEHEYLYWEFARKHQALRVGDWKAYRPRPWAAIELYDLAKDPAEQWNVAANHPEVVAEMRELFAEAHTDSALFPLAQPPVEEASLPTASPARDGDPAAKPEKREREE